MPDEEKLNQAIEEDEPPLECPICEPAKLTVVWNPVDIIIVSLVFMMMFFFFMLVLDILFLGELQDKNDRDYDLATNRISAVASIMAGIVSIIGIYIKHKISKKHNDD